ncbi:MAG: tail fiber protein, partial [Bacteroidota bacterium]
SLNYGSGTERKFFFDKSKGAFRAGEISNDNWNADSLEFASFAAGKDTKATSIAATALGEKTSASGLAATAMGTETTASGLAATAMGAKTTASGLASTAFGTETLASGTYATAFGEQTKAEDLAATAFGSFTVASGNFATAFGLETEASGSYATVFGQSTTASGDHTTAFGGFTMASGDYATAFGRSTTAPSYGEVVMGINNTTYAPNSTTGFNSSDRLFILGNGVAASHPSDALIIYKNGNTELNGALTIDGNYTFPTTDGTSGEVLSTDGNGNVSWTADNNTDDQALSFSGTTLSITDGNSVNLSSLVPVGTIQMWPTSSPPTGWLICNGSSFSSSTYPDLANVLGGTTLPNFNGRFPLGVGNSGTSGSTTHNIGSNGGAEKHTLSINEMPNHSHGAGSLSTSEPYLSQNGSGDQDKRDGGGTKLFEYSSITGNTSSAGGGQAHNNMPPFYVIHFIIRAE